MIDIVISESRVLMVAHDIGDLPDIDTVVIDDVGDTVLLLADSTRRPLRRLAPRMLALALECQAAKVTIMDGYAVEGVYDCELRLPAVH